MSETNDTPINVKDPYKRELFRRILNPITSNAATLIKQTPENQPISPAKPFIPTEDTRTEQDKGMTRRAFLGHARNALLGLLFEPKLRRFALHPSEVPNPQKNSTDSPREEPVSKEKLVNNSRTVLVVDFPSGNEAEITENGITDYHDIERRVFRDMSDRYLDREQLIKLLQTMKKYEPNGGVIVKPADFDEPWPELIQDVIALGYPELAAWYAFLNRYRTHGTKVAEAAKTSWDVVGASGERQLLSLGEFLQPDTVNFQQDEWRNSGIKIQLKAEHMIPKIQLYRNTHQELMKEGVVNMSLQAGEVQLWIASQSNELAYPHLPIDVPFYDHESSQDLRVIVPQGEVNVIFDQYLRVVRQEDGVYILENQNPSNTGERIQYRGYANRSDATTAVNEARNTYRIEYAQEASNPGSHEVGAYTGDNRLEHAREMITIANAFPDLFFCVAAGNNADDLRGLYEDGTEVPNNLLFIGQWSTSWDPPRPSFNVLGADFYISNEIPGKLIDPSNDEMINLGTGSSFSTPQISALVGVLRGRGVPIEGIIPALTKLSEEISFPLDSSKPDGKMPTARVITMEKVEKLLSRE